MSDHDDDIDRASALAADLALGTIDDAGVAQALRGYGVDRAGIEHLAREIEGHARTAGWLTLVSGEIPGVELGERVRRAIQGAPGPEGDMPPDSGRPLPVAVPGARMHLIGHRADGSARDLLLRLAPGTTFPGHAHPEGEALLALQGDLRLGEAPEVGPGHLEVSPPGSHHEPLSTRDGCLCLVHEGPLA